MKNLIPNSLTLLIILIFVFTSCCKNENREVNQKEEKLLIEKVINNSIGWAKEKDINLLYSVIANDTEYLEVHPNDRVVKGFEDFRKSEAFWLNPDFKAIRYQIRDLQINISKSGDAAWWYSILDDINEWKGQPANWENTRWTGVLEKREGKWVIVQMHFSFASK